ncbi:MAG TPA: glycosyltransferase family 4 protein [Gemmatimonadales bacterium]|nr:glycosyltransferase family 4 protein [Gemmatimonadales bacterium]
MRIALVTEFYYPHLGGVTEHVHNLAKVYNAAGHQTLVVTSNMTMPRGTPDSHEYAEDEDFVRRVGTSRVIYSSGSFARITTGFGLRRQLRDLFRREQVDVVHIHGGLAPTFGILGPLAAWDIDLPVVATFHSWFPKSHLLRTFRRPAQWCVRKQAANIAVSQPVVDAHARYVDADWEIIPNGVDTRFFRPNGRLPADALSQSPRLLFLGRLDPRNGLETVLRAMPTVLEQFPETRLVVAGDGPLRPLYERLARPVADRVDFIGRVNGDRPEVYASADLYLCPTTKASFGITLLEAMACGTPLVVSDITGFRELVSGGQEAVLVPKDDTAAWARTAIDLIANPDRRVAMRDAGLAKAQVFSWPRVAEQVFAVYERVTK